MTGGEVVLTILTAFGMTAVSALVWGTYRRLDHRIDRFEERLDTQVASVRADLTQVALAVGAPNRPRASG